MRISTFSVIAGTSACNAKCPFCVSKMTGRADDGGVINWRNFAIACRLARQSNVTTAMITGKGEPTLYPDQITQYLSALQATGIPLIELQTNGLKLANAEFRERYLRAWHASGLTTVAISVVHYEQKTNQTIYCPEHFDLAELIKKLHWHGFSVRISCVLLKDYADTVFVDGMIEYAKKAGAEQLTFTPLNGTSRSENDEVAKWASANKPSDSDIQEIYECLRCSGHELMRLAHGAIVFDIRGQNVCLSNCLGKAVTQEDIRNLIFYPNGRLAYDWQYSGAVIL